MPRHHHASGDTRTTAITAAFLTLCVFAGGGTRQGLAIEALLQLMSLPLLVHAVMRLDSAWRSAAVRLGLIWAVLLVGWNLVQLLPLPPAWWTGLGGRAPLVEELRLAGITIGWRPITLDIDATRRATLALLPPISAGLLTLGLPRSQQQRLLQLVAGLAIGSALLGLAQLAGGDDSTLRWHDVTNVNSAVGPFANRNHLATLLALALPLTAAQMIEAGSAHERHPRRVGMLALAIVAAVVLMITLAIVRSRSGVLLAAVAAFACALMLWRRQAPDERPRSGARRWLAAAGIGGLLLAIQFGFWGLLQRFEADPLQDLRWTITRNTLHAAEQFGPFGVGAGGFIAAYESTQPPLERMNVHINRAHNDWAEWWLEGGWPLAVLLGLGLLLLAWRSITAWRHRGSHVLWPRAAGIGLWLILLHSLSDYPLRTTSIATIAAVLFAHLLSAPRASAGERFAHSSTHVLE